MTRTTGDFLRPLDDPATHRAVLAERRALAELEGGCMIPMAAWARDVDVDVEGEEDQLIHWPSMPRCSTLTAALASRPRSAARAMILTAWATASRRPSATRGPKRCSGSFAGIRKGGLESRPHTMRFGQLGPDRHIVTGSCGQAHRRAGWPALSAPACADRRRTPGFL